MHVEGNIFYSFFIEYLVLKPKYGKLDLTSLSDSELSQYNRLRDWRNELAASEGLPAYIIMYNSQILDIINKQPKAKSDFATIKGMKTKGDKYGEQIIKLSLIGTSFHREAQQTASKLSPSGTLFQIETMTNPDRVPTGLIMVVAFLCYLKWRPAGTRTTQNESYK
ncbi:MAG: HRDC domain-containing protein [Candidatus Cloacimonetes bacterium]|nr:HRDC domain-containing protein [Candidatus Cloacimonadota bacterium]